MRTAPPCRPVGYWRPWGTTTVMALFENFGNDARQNGSGLSSATTHWEFHGNGLAPDQDFSRKS